MNQNTTDTMQTGGCDARDRTSALPSEDNIKLCPYCGKELHRQSIKLYGTTIYGPYDACDCSRGRADSEREEEERTARVNARRAAEEREEYLLRRKESGIGSRQYDQTFETFKVNKDNRAAYDAALDFAKNYHRRYPEDPAPESDVRGLMFIGGVGVGKTHLASAIANYILSHGEWVLFRTVPALLSEIKQTYGGSDSESEWAMMERYKRKGLLILDDLAKEQPTEWSLSRLYEILDSRYMNYMPVIVTANYNLDGLQDRLSVGDNTAAAACVSRLCEMCRVYAITGKDRRMNVS